MSIHMWLGVSHAYPEHVRNSFFRAGMQPVLISMADRGHTPAHKMAALLLSGGMCMQVFIRHWRKR